MIITRGRVQAGPQKGQRRAVLWTRLQPRIGTPSSPHPGPSFPHHGPVCWWGWGSSGVTSWGRGDPSSAFAPALGYAYIHSSQLGSEGNGLRGHFNLRIEREGKGRIPSSCFWKEVKSIVALLEGSHVDGGGAQHWRSGISSPLKTNPWHLSSSTKLSTRILQTQPPSFAFVGSSAVEDPGCLCLFPHPHRLSLPALTALLP